MQALETRPNFYEKQVLVKKKLRRGEKRHSRAFLPRLHIRDNRLGLTLTETDWLVSRKLLCAGAVLGCTLILVSSFVWNVVDDISYLTIGDVGMGAFESRYKGHHIGKSIASYFFLVSS